MKLLILLCANLLSALDTTDTLQQTLPVYADSKLHTFTDSSTPFTIEYADNVDTLISSTACFARHLRNLTNESNSSCVPYFDCRAQKTVFNVYLLKDQKFIRLENRNVERTKEKINTLHHLKEFLSHVEKNEVSIWNINESRIPLSTLEHKKKPYQISIWYAVIGSNQLKLMQTQLHNQQTSECINEFIGFAD